MSGKSNACEIANPKDLMVVVKAADKFGWCLSHDFLKISPCCGTLAVAYVVEQLYNVCFRICFQRFNYVFDATMCDVLNEGHPCVLLEGFAYVCTIGV